MALKINHSALAHARKLISENKINRGEWKWNKADHSPEELKKICLAVDPSATEGTKEQYEYPFGTESEVNAKAISSAEGYAKTNGETELHAELVKLSDEIAKRKEHSVEASKILFCNAQEIAPGSELPREITLITPGVHHLVDTQGNEVVVDVTPDKIQSAIRYQQLLKSRNPQLDLVVDCDHATHYPSAGPAYAYAWMKSFRDAAREGLKTAIDYTTLGAEAIAKKWLRFFSPTIAINLKDVQSGEVFPFAITDGAFTNQPQIETLPAVLAAKRLYNSNNSNQGEDEMKELVKLLCSWLGKPETATEDELKSAFQAKTQEIINASKSQITSAMEQLGFDKGTTPEEAKAIVVMARANHAQSGNLAGQLFQVTADAVRVEAKKFVSGLVECGKIFQSQHDDILGKVNDEIERSLKIQDVVQAKKSLDGWVTMASKWPVVAPLTHIEPGNANPGKVVTDVAKEIAKNLGIDPQKMVA
jgi:phage I-like protein